MNRSAPHRGTSRKSVQAFFSRSGLSYSVTQARINPQHTVTVFPRSHSFIPRGHGIFSFHLFYFHRSHTTNNKITVPTHTTTGVRSAQPTLGRPRFLAGCRHSAS
ncbi:unnamed protein product [Ectocarpus sp. 13 AM-2016]